MEKIWQKWNLKLNSLIEDYTVWNDYLLDMELIPYDIKWSKAHVKMLYKIWVLNDNEKEALLKWLD
jgi:argininosuccinate lyase